MSRPFARSFVVSLALVSFALGLSGCAKEPAALPSGVVQENTISSTATVKKIDLKTREVTLVGAEGKPFIVKCGPEVRNLPQLKIGDEVTATYYESLAYEVHKPGTVEPGTRASVGAARAEEGQRPGAVTANVVQITATIESIDKSVPSVTLRRADGELIPVKVRDAKKLDAVSVGDMVEITYTEAMAISVDQPGAK
jgi:hypothetical protein